MWDSEIEDIIIHNVRFCSVLSYSSLLYARFFLFRPKQRHTVAELRPGAFDCEVRTVTPG